MSFVVSATNLVRARTLSGFRIASSRCRLECRSIEARSSAPSTTSTDRRRLKIWLAHVGEPLPIDAKNERQLRMSLIARMLAQRGHEVTWWSSTFDHTHKRQRFPSNQRVDVSDGLVLQLLLTK